MYAFSELFFTLRVVLVVVAEHGSTDALYVPQIIFPVRLHSYFSLSSCLTQTTAISSVQEVRVYNK